MKKTFLKLILFALAIFIIGTFYVGLKKTEIYDTKNLIGTNLDNFTLNSLNEDLESHTQKSQLPRLQFLSLVYSLYYCL